VVTRVLEVGGFLRNYLWVLLMCVLCFWGILYVGRSGAVQKDKDRVEFSILIRGC
jgi:hypothetical protein